MTGDLRPNDVHVTSSYCCVMAYRQTINRSNAGLLFNGLFGKNCSEISNKNTHMFCRRNAFEMNIYTIFL